MTRLNPMGPFPVHFGRYEVKGRLGGGGMAEVYRAHDSVFDIEVALKVPRDEVAANAQFRELFIHEGRAMARLDHPNICRIFDLGAIGGTPYLTMPLISGNPLGE